MRIEIDLKSTAASAAPAAIWISGSGTLTGRRWDRNTVTTMAMIKTSTIAISDIHPLL
jgi:hypothetical protein